MPQRFRISLGCGDTEGADFPHHPHSAICGSGQMVRSLGCHDNTRRLCCGEKADRARSRQTTGIPGGEAAMLQPAVHGTADRSRHADFSGRRVPQIQEREPSFRLRPSFEPRFRASRRGFRDGHAPRPRSRACNLLVVLVQKMSDGLENYFLGSHVS
jgi:hypothetical protein